MADKNKARQIEEKIRQALEKLGKSLDQALDALANPRRLYPQPIPIPIDRPYRRRRRPADD
ncbi:MAG: hypothetical protein AB1801_13390 [Chloroflexota bacterium]